MSTSLARQRLQADLILLFVAAVWGSGFVAQRVAGQVLGAFIFNGGRFLLGSLLLLVLVRFRLRIERRMLPWTALAGMLLFGAAALQQVGLKTTTAGNAGFLTTLYVIIVPLYMLVLFRKRLGWRVWTAAGLAVLGAFLLSGAGRVQLSGGDALEIAGAFLWAAHVMLVGWVVQRTDPTHFSIGQFFVCGVLNLAVGLAFEVDTLARLPDVFWTVLYGAVFPVTIGYTLQAVGQRHAPPTDAAILLSLESVFAGLFGWLLLAEQYSPVQIVGAGLILAAALLAQFSPAEETITTEAQSAQRREGLSTDEEDDDG